MKRILLGIFLTVSMLSFSEAMRTPYRDKKKEDMELVFILDRSGSMGGLESDTIGGYNSTLEKQKKASKGKVYVTTVLFDDRYEMLYKDVPVSEVKPLTEDEYFVRGSTALLDAVGKTVTQLKNDRSRVSRNKRAGKVLIVIITDGMENASREYTNAAVKRLIEAQKADKWEFLFLGANIDVAEAAGNIGIESERAVRYKSDSIGTQNNYKVLDKVINNYRNGTGISDDWKKEIEEDVQKRGQ